MCRYYNLCKTISLTDILQDGYHYGFSDFHVFADRHRLSNHVLNVLDVKFVSGSRLKIVEKIVRREQIEGREVLMKASGAVIRNSVTRYSVLIKTQQLATAQ